MKKSEVKINEIYMANVSGKLRPVRVLAPGTGTGYAWLVLNLVTGRKILLRTSARLRRKATAKDLEILNARHGTGD